MSIKLARAPKVISTGWPAEIDFIKSPYFTTLGGYASIAIKLSALPSNGQTLKIKKDGLAYIDFTFSSNPVTSTQLPITAAPGKTYAATVAAHLMMHKLLYAEYRALFYSTAGDDIVVLKALKRGSDYNLSIDVSSTVSATYDIVNATDDVAPENYRLKLHALLQTDIWHEQKSNLLSYIEARGLVDADNNQMAITVHDLPALCRGFFSDELPENFFKTLPYRHNYGTLSWKAEEAANDELTGKMIESSGDDIIVLDNRPALHNTPWEESFIAATGIPDNYPLKPLNITAGNSFKKLVSLQQPEWYSFYCHLLSGFTVTYRVKFADGYEASTSVNSIANNSVRGIYYVPAGWAQVPELQALRPGVAPLFWSVEAEGGDLVVSPLTYVNDVRFFREERYFIFCNSNGVVDTLRCVGVSEYTVKRKNESGALVHSSSTREQQGTLQMIYSEREDIYTIRTGWLLNKEEKELLLDFISSNRIAEVYSQYINPVNSTVQVGKKVFTKQPYRNMVLLTDSLDMWEESDGAWAAEFKLKAAHNNIGYNTVLPLQEYWTDSAFEFNFEVTAVTGVGPKLRIASNGGLTMVTVNGVTTRLSAAFIDITITVGHYKILVESSDCTELVLTATSITCTATPLKLESKDIAILTLLNMEVKGEYFIQRLLTMYRLQNLTVWSLTSGGFDANGALVALAQLQQHPFSSLVNIDFDINVPSGAGVSAKAALINAGITVNTA